MKKALSILLALCLMLGALAACGNNSNDTPNDGDSGGNGGGQGGNVIYFGVNYELTGANPIIGESAIKGIDMAVDEINAAGGVTVNGTAYQLAYRALDNGFNTDESALNAQEFADDADIVAQIGPNDSDMCMATQKIVGDEGLATISPWSTLVELTDCDYYFRACFTDDFQGYILAKYAYDFEKATTAAVLYDMSNPYNEGVASRFKEAFESFGGKVVEYQTYNGKTGETDFTSQMTKIASANPDILLLPNFYEEIITQTTQARQMGYTGKFMGSDTWGDASLLEWDTENLLDGALWVGHYHKDVASDAALEFIANYHDRYGSDGDPNDIVALNYDAVHLLQLAIEKAQSLERKDIRDGLASIEMYEGVTGNMKFDNGNGDPTKSAAIIQISDGEFKYLDTVEP
ncbi:MAG: ABC transporter substrate-binding protein [Oscillospiraceae bacterium]|nr:ABC transporter substrate-binding protein [Oscillospiraceae bacterium]